MVASPHHAGFDYSGIAVNGDGRRTIAGAGDEFVDDSPNPRRRPPASPPPPRHVPGQLPRPDRTVKIAPHPDPLHLLLPPSIHTLDSLEDVKQDYAAYENVFFGKIQEGVDIAASHPLSTTGAVVGFGLIALKRPRRFLYYKTLHLLMSEESLLSKAEAKVHELRKSIDQQKSESEKLERDAKIAGEAMIHGRTKLRHAGKQIQGVIQSA